MTLDARVDVSVGSFHLDAAFTVTDGETLAVLGPNGAGKTTLLRALSGLLAVDKGRITLDGRVLDDPVTDTFVPPERRAIGVMFQDYLLFAHMTALDNVAFGLRERGSSKPAARERARAMLADVGLDAFTASRPLELSGGQAQRVALARLALAIEPSLLLLDEPLAALDAQVRVDTRRHLRDALARFSGARLLVTHDLVDALALADRLLILENGRVVQDGPADAVLMRPASPYVAELAGVNFYRGEADGELIRTPGGSIVSAEPHSGRVIVVIPAHAVALHRSQPVGSARNVWPATVDGMERNAGRVRVRLAGTMPLVAEITPAAVSALDLTDGAPVWAAVKATEVEVHPA